RRVGELFDGRNGLRGEVGDADRRIESPEGRANVGDRRLSDLAREPPCGLVVDVALWQVPCEPLAKTLRPAKGLADAFRAYALGDPRRRGELPLETGGHHHRVDTRLDTGHHDLLHRDVGDPVHVERIGHAQYREAELAAEQV